MVCDSFSLANIYAEVFAVQDIDTENMKTLIGIIIDAQEYTMQSISHGFMAHVISWLDEQSCTEPVESEQDIKRDFDGGTLN